MLVAMGLSRKVLGINRRLFHEDAFHFSCLQITLKTVGEGTGSDHSRLTFLPFLGIFVACTLLSYQNQN